MKNNFKLYTKEQEEKIERLRMEAEEERLLKKNPEPIADFYFKVGDLVFVTLDGKTISGYIISKKGNGYRDAIYNVKTPIEILVNLKRSVIKDRYMKPLSGVKVPEELKKISTKSLLMMLRTKKIITEAGFIVDLSINIRRMK